jgi:hypothetical protein
MATSGLIPGPPMEIWDFTNLPGLLTAFSL